MKNFIRKQSLLDILLVLLCGMLLCYMGFVNAFPLMYPDCGTYILSGFTLKVPVDRPIFYGLFVRHISLQTSLWLVIWTQGTLLALVVFYYFKYLSGTRRFRFYYILCIAVLTFFTPASFNVSQLIPDIFAPVSILALGLLLFAGNMKKRDVVVTTVILVYALAVHNSHLFINVLLLLVFTIIFLIRRFRRELEVFSLKLKKLAYAWIVIIFTFFMVCSVHAGLGGGFSYARGSHVFLMARLLEMGILDEYLHDNCDKKHYKLCEYKDKIPWNFLWDFNNSPLYKYGDGWTLPQVKEEYNAIIWDIMTTPKYGHLFLVKSAESTVKQFFNFCAGDAPAQLDDSPSHIVIAQHYPACMREFKVSAQHSNLLNLFIAAEIQKFVFQVCLFLCLALLFFPSLGGKYNWIILFMLAGMLANAFFCGTFSTVLPRYQTRVMWLMVVPLVLIMANREMLVPTVKRLFRKDSLDNG